MPYAAADRRQEQAWQSHDVFIARGEYILGLFKDCERAIYDGSLSQNAALKIMRLRLDEANEKLKEMEGE